MNQEEKNQENYDGVDLINYLRVIIKKKWLIFGIFLLTVISVLIFTLRLPKVYKIDTSLEIGNVGGELIEKPGQVVEKIKGEIYKVLIQEKLGIAAEKYPKIKAENPKDTALVNIEIESVDPQLAINILKETNNLILEGHRDEVEAKKELLEKDIERIKTKIGSLGEEKKNLEAQIGILEKTPFEGRSPEFQFTLLSTKESLEKKKQEIENLYLQINSLQRSLEDIQPTRIVKEPTVSEKPVKPKPVLNIIIAAILGIFIGTFFAFFREWWEKNKSRI